MHLAQRLSLQKSDDLKVLILQYLCNGLEDDIWHHQQEMGNTAGSELDRMVNASGKMVLLHKLLPKLRAEGRKVLPRITTFPFSWNKT